CRHLPPLGAPEATADRSEGQGGSGSGVIALGCARPTPLVSSMHRDGPMGLKEVRPMDEPIESAVCVWCGHDISHERGVCQGCGSPITAASRIIMANPQVVAHRSTSGTPTGSPDQAPRPADAVPSEGPRSTPEPSRSVHTARLVSLI